MANELKKSHLQWLRREFDQVGVAMSIVGTNRPMLLRMARRLDPLIDGLRGERPEIRKVRENLVRARNNLQRGPTTPLRSSRNMWITRDLLDEILVLQDKGFLGLPEEFDYGSIVLKNVWGYKGDEIRVFRVLLQQVVVRLESLGLDELIYGVAFLDPDKAGSRFFSWDEKNDSFVVNPSRGRMKADIYSAFGDRLWHKGFERGDRQSWSSRSQFLKAFARVAGGGEIDSESEARMQVSAGRVAGSDWQGI